MRPRRRCSTCNKLTVKPVTEEPDVKSVLAKVELDAVDAGVVYVTDVKAAGAKVVGVEIPAAQNVSTSYPIATLKASKNAPLAAAFMAYVLSADGQSVLSRTAVRRTLTVEPTIQRGRCAGRASASAAGRPCCRWGWRSCSCRSLGLIIRAPWARLPELLSEGVVAQRATAVADHRVAGHGGVAGARGAAGLGARPAHVSRAQRRPGLRHGAAGAAARRRWRRPVPRVRSTRRRRRPIYDATGWSAPVHDRSGRGRGDVRRHAVPRRHRRRRAPRGGHAATRRPRPPWAPVGSPSSAG